MTIRRSLTRAALAAALLAALPLTARAETRVMQDAQGRTFRVERQGGRMTFWRGDHRLGSAREHADGTMSFRLRSSNGRTTYYPAQPAEEPAGQIVLPDTGLVTAPARKRT